MKKHTAFRIALSLFVLLIFGHTGGFDFTYFDDDALIIARKHTLTQTPDIEQIFTSDAFGGNSNPYYRPLQTLSYNLDGWLNGEISPAYLHGIQILLFLGVVLGVFSLLIALNFSSLWSLILSFVFAAHPLFASAVSWQPARGDLLMALSGTWSLYFFVHFCKERKLGMLIGSGLLYLIALFTKESAAFLPISLLLYFVLRSERKRPSLPELGFGALLIVVTGGWMVLRQVSISGSEFKMSGGELMLQFLSIPNMLSQSLLPFDLSPLPAFEMWKTLSGLLILALWVLGYRYVSKENRRLYLFGLCWYLLFIIPTCFTHVDGFDYLDHRSLFPMIGWIISLAVFFSEKCPEHKFSFNHPAVWGSALFVLMSCFISVQKAEMYKDPETFAREANQSNPTGLSYSLLGSYLLQKGDVRGAYNCFTTAIEHSPSFLVYAKRAQIRSNSGDLKGAVEDYTMALKYQDNILVYFNRALVRKDMGDIQGAREDILHFLQKKPNDFNAQSLLHELN